MSDIIDPCNTQNIEFLPRKQGKSLAQSIRVAIEIEQLMLKVHMSQGQLVAVLLDTDIGMALCKFGQTMMSEIHPKLMFSGVPVKVVSLGPDSRDKRCISIEYTKPNGRTAYMDHPSCHPDYL